VYVQKRPGVDAFLHRMSQLYEVIIYTASIDRYAQPLLKLLDPLKLTSHHLYRDSCTIVNNAFVKDLKLLGRDLARTVIVDNTPSAYMLQPENAIPILTWTGDPSDNKLNELIPLLEELNSKEDARKYITDKYLPLLKTQQVSNRISKDIPLLIKNIDEEVMKVKSRHIRMKEDITIKNKSHSHQYKVNPLCKLSDGAYKGNCIYTKRVNSGYKERLKKNVKRHSIRPDTGPLELIVQQCSKKPRINTSEMSPRKMFKSIRQLGAIISQSFNLYGSKKDKYGLASNYNKR
jgi:RNA polymerase II subunit A small phosphatase-like protein